MASPAEMPSFLTGVPTLLTVRLFLLNRRTLQLKLHSMLMQIAASYTTQELLQRI
jgi:hypothetical protein